MRIFKSIISIFLAICIVLSFAGCKKDEESPQKEENASEENLSIENVTTNNNAETHLDVNVADELEFYYLNLFYQTYSVAYFYETQYGEGTGKMFTGYDVNLSPEEQTTKNEDGETITFAEYFYEGAVRAMAASEHSDDLAIASGVKLTEEEKKEIDDAVTTFIENEFVQQYYNTAVVNEVYKKVLTHIKYTEYYEDMIREKCNDADEINSIYEKDKTEYDVVSFRWFTIDYDSSAVSEATAFINKVTSVAGYSEETFKSVVLETVGEGNSNYEAYKEDNSTKIEKVDKETLEGNVGKDAADWFFETDTSGRYVRKSGDIRYFIGEDEESIYIIYATGTPFRDNDILRSVRHILLKDSTKAEAQKVLDEYLAKAGSGVDEEYFIELVNKYTEDTGSKSNGGLIADMRNDGRYVSAFEDWAFAEGEFAGQERKPGTTGIVESEYGYHIMFYSSEYENPAWYEEILDELTDVEWEKINIEVDVEEFEKQNIDSETKESVIAKCIETIEKTFGFIA